ncbi:MAG TPA: hypothetical protein VF771_08845, partial [Longimicrobiaceae bacterium]
MRSFRSIPISTALACIALACARGAAQQAQTLAGTYRIAVCREPCAADDTARALAWGVLVLGNEPLDPKKLPEAEWLGDDDDAKYNACFALDQVRNAPILAGVQPAGLTRWEKDARGGVRVLLYRSSDSGYEAVLRTTPDGLRGRGHGWGIDQGPEKLPDDSLAARRTGPPDPSLCVPMPSALARIAADRAFSDSL